MLMEKPPFDELKRLAEHHPADFEALRTELVETLIRQTPPARQHRLRGLQFVIDSRRSLAGNPVKAMIEIQSMMHRSLNSLNDALQSLQPVSADSLQTAPGPRTSNVVSLFPG